MNICSQTVAVCTPKTSTDKVVYFKNTKSISYNGKYRKTSPIRQTTSQQIFHSLIYIYVKKKKKKTD